MTRTRLGKTGAILTAVLVVVGCGAPQSALTGGDSQSGTIAVVTTFSLLGDIVHEVAGEHVEVHSMVPQGTDPHDYQPLPEDIQAATQADVLVWNGLGMEMGGGWFPNLVEVAGKQLDEANVIEASNGVDALLLGGRGEPNPHAFLSPQAGAVYVDNIEEGLILADPANATYYRERAARYKEELHAIDQRYHDELAALPNPVLVTSERAFQYVAADYGLEEGYLWPIDTDEQATPNQIIELIDFIDRKEPHGLLIETNVDPRPMEIVSEETGVPVVGEVYSDELGPAGSPASTYVDYLAFNLRAYVAAGGG